ncbi:uncharacterized protein BJX67DRAFT_11065 [Aspergillus lucknowensis]|uniref:Transmembrane protein n=1 Tax=Aspergillus lucknowensis TaxID=176173 RepID=A0ABR4M7F8_9EURO
MDESDSGNWFGSGLDQVPGWFPFREYHEKGQRVLTAFEDEWRVLWSQGSTACTVMNSPASFHGVITNDSCIGRTRVAGRLFLQPGQSPLFSPPRFSSPFPLAPPRPSCPSKFFVLAAVSPLLLSPFSTFFSQFHPLSFRSQQARQPRFQHRIRIRAIPRFLLPSLCSRFLSSLLVSACQSSSGGWCVLIYDLNIYPIRLFSPPNGITKSILRLPRMVYHQLACLLNRCLIDRFSRLVG